MLPQDFAARTGQGRAIGQLLESGGCSRFVSGPHGATTTGDVDMGLNGSTAHAIANIMPIVEVKSDLEAALDKVVAAGGTITLPIFAFPGGRRFHFRDPHGHELGVCINEPGTMQD